MTAVEVPSEAQAELDQLSGGVIVASYIKDGGFHLVLQDGRVLIFAADQFAIGITHPCSEKLH